MKLDNKFRGAFIAGAERVAAWADLLDDINVFPVADGDTGRNLMISLSPLMQLEEEPQNTIAKLFLSARGNSGNIAAQFFSGFLTADSYAALPEAAKTGRDQAWDAVRAACDSKYADYAIYEHCLPFNVARAYDEARGIDAPRIWTAERDTAMWADLQG